MGDLEERLSRLKSEIIAVKQDFGGQAASLKPIALAESDAVAIGSKLDTLISEYLKVRDKVTALQEQGKI